jgi:hypothetical protein
MYKGSVPIPALAMVDDIVNISQCNSVQGIKNNVQTDEFIKMKKLEGQVGDGKCQWLHIGSNNCDSTYVINKSNTTRCNVYKYLGDHVSDGWEPLYRKRHERAQGYAVRCQAMCTEISLGYQLYHIAKLLHAAIFLNGSLVNMETWPHFSEKRISLFERAEQGLFRRILSAHSKTPIEAFYLELGIMPFRFHLMMRRITYFHEILNRSDNELTKRVVVSQLENGTKGDFAEQVLNDMGLLNITKEESMALSSNKLKDMLKEKAGDAAFHHLITKARVHTKVNEEVYTNLDGMTYMKHPQFSPDLVNILFKFRTRMYNVKNNFRNNYTKTNTLCPLCNLSEDTQSHLFDCTMIVDQKNKPTTTTYKDIFSPDINRLLDVAKELKTIVKIREDLESEMNENHEEVEH